MVEMSTSGSGEGPGWETGWGYSTDPFAPSRLRRMLHDEPGNRTRVVNGAGTKGRGFTISMLTERRRP